MILLCYADDFIKQGIDLFQGVLDGTVLLDGDRLLGAVVVQNHLAAGVVVVAVGQRCLDSEQFLAGYAEAELGQVVVVTHLILLVGLGCETRRQIAVIPRMNAVPITASVAVSGRNWNSLGENGAHHW